MEKRDEKPLNITVLGPNEDDGERDVVLKQQAATLAHKVIYRTPDRERDFLARLTGLAELQLNTERGVTREEIEKLRPHHWRDQFLEICTGVEPGWLEGRTENLHTQKYIGNSEKEFGGRRVSTCVVASTINCLAAEGVPIPDAGALETVITKLLLERPNSTVQIDESGYFGAHTPVAICQILNERRLLPGRKVEAKWLMPTAIAVINALLEGQTIVYSRAGHAKAIIGIYPRPSDGEIMLQVVDPLTGVAGKATCNSLTFNEFINGSPTMGGLLGGEEFLGISVESIRQ